MVVGLTTAGENSQDISVLVDLGVGAKLGLSSKQLVELVPAVKLIIEHYLLTIKLKPMTREEENYEISDHRPLLLAGS